MSRTWISDYCSPRGKDSYEERTAKKLVTEATNVTSFAENGPANLLSLARVIDDRKRYGSAAYIIAVDLQTNEVYFGLALCNEKVGDNSYYADFKVVSAMASGLCDFGVIYRVSYDAADDLYCRVVANEREAEAEEDHPQVILFVQEVGINAARTKIACAIEYCNHQVANWADKLLLAGRAIIEGTTDGKKEVEEMLDMSFNL